MAHIETEMSDRVEVVHDSREFSFNRGSDGLKLVFVRTKFRKSDEVTSDYPTVEDIPNEVIDVLDASGYDVVDVE